MMVLGLGSTRFVLALKFTKIISLKKSYFSRADKIQIFGPDPGQVSSSHLDRGRIDQVRMVPDSWEPTECIRWNQLGFRHRIRGFSARPGKVVRTIAFFIEKSNRYDCAHHLVDCAHQNLVQLNYQ